jgi:hypothetical protein
MLEDSALMRGAQVRASTIVEGLHTSHPKHGTNYTPRIEDGQYISRGNTESIDTVVHVESATK